MFQQARLSFSITVLVFVTGFIFVKPVHSNVATISDQEAEILHWVLYEASKKQLSDEVKLYFSESLPNDKFDAYLDFLDTHKSFYKQDISKEDLFNKIIKPKGYDNLFIALHSKWNTKQINKYKDKHNLKDRHYEIINLIDKGKLYETALIKSDLNIRLLAFDGTEIPSPFNEEIHNLFNIWQQTSTNYSHIENALISAFFARTFYRIQEPEKIKQVFHKDNLNFLPPIDYVLYTYILISYSFFERGLFEEIIELSRSYILPYTGPQMFGSLENYVELSLSFAMSLLRVGNINEAKSNLEDLEPILLDTNYGLQRYYSYFFNNLGVVYHRIGRFNDYLDLQLQAIEYARDFGETSAELHYLNNLYRFYRSNDNWDQAEYYLQQGVEIARQSSEEDHADILLSMAIYQRDYKHDYPQAESYFEDAHELALVSENLITITRVKTEWAVLLREQEKFEQAAELHREVMRLSEEADSHRSRIDATTRFAELHIDRQDMETAGDYVSKLREENLDEYDFRLQLRVINLFSRYRFRVGEKNEALEKLTPYVQEALERVQNSSDYQTGRASLIPVLEDSFRLYATILFEKEEHSRLLTFLDRLNNLSQADFHNHHLLKSQVLSEEELIYDNELTQIIEELRSRLRTAEGSERADLNEMLLKAENEKNRLRHKIHDQSAFNPVDIRRLQRSLSRDEMILNYSMIDNRMYIHAIYRDQIKGRVVEFDDLEVFEIEQFIDDLHNGNTDLEFLYQLKSRLIEPEWLQGIAHLEVVPDHFMYYIPHEILPVSAPAHPSAYGSSRYLIEELVIHYRHSLNERQQTPAVSRSTGLGWSNEIIAMGVKRTHDQHSVLNPDASLPALPFAAREASEIRQLYNQHQSCRVFTNEAANYSNFVSKAGGSRILHLATHGEVSPHDPLFSVIYFGGNDEDEQSHVYAYELFEMNLQNELVVLSSCESGAGTYVKGGGIAGLSRAFRFAGARSMATNLWPVRDETAARLSTEFHRNLNKGYPKDKALQQAKLDYLNYRNSDPYWWGAMTIYGDPSPVYREPASRRVAFFLLLGWLLTVIIVGMYRSGTRFNQQAAFSYQLRPGEQL